MLSPIISSSANVATLVKGTANDWPLGGTPSQSPPLVPRKTSPCHPYGVVAERHSRGRRASGSGNAAEVGDVRRHSAAA